MKRRNTGRKKERNLLAGYPEIFLTIASNAYIGKKPESLSVLSEQSSYPQLHRFNRFRNLLVEMRHPHALAAKDLIARREQDENGLWWLTFEPSGLYEIQAFAPSLQNPDSPLIAEQAHEEEIEKRMKKDSGEELMENWVKNRSEENLDVEPLPPAQIRFMASIGVKAEELNPNMLDRELGVGEFKETGEEKEARERIERCGHKWDVYGSCNACSVSKIEWERKTYSRFAQNS